PEEKFYPVIDGQLDAWQRTDRVEVAELRVVGDRWSRPSYQVRDFLSRNHVPYQWMLAEEQEGAQLVAAAGDDCRLPLVVTADGTMLQAPGQSTLAATVGLSTTPATNFYDLIVVGGGPAGLGAAVYGASEGLRTVLVERHATGGQAGQSSRIENYLGFPDGASGTQLTDRARRQAAKFGAEALTAREGGGRGSVPGCSAPAMSPGGRRAARPASCGSATAPRSARTPSCWPPACPTAASTRPASPSSPGAACTTAPRPPRRRPAAARTST